MFCSCACRNVVQSTKLTLLAQVEPSAKRIRDLYEAAVDQFGSSYPGKYGRS